MKPHTPDCRLRLWCGRTATDNFRLLPSQDSQSNRTLANTEGKAQLGWGWDCSPLPSKTASTGSVHQLRCSSRRGSPSLRKPFEETPKPESSALDCGITLPEGLWLCSANYVKHKTLVGDLVKNKYWQKPVQFPERLHLRVVSSKGHSETENPVKLCDPWSPFASVLGRPHLGTWGYIHTSSALAVVSSWCCFFRFFVSSADSGKEDRHGIVTIPHLHSECRFTRTASSLWTELETRATANPQVT